MLMLHTSSSVLCGVLLGTLLFGTSALAQSSTAGSPVGADQIEAILTQQPSWTVYWSSLGAAPRPPASAAADTIHFRRDGNQIMGHLKTVFGQECDFTVTVKENGFIYPGCARYDKELIYDPSDSEYPFKGTARSYGFWLRRQ